SPDIVLLLVAAPHSKPDSALTRSTSALVFEPLTADRIPRWIIHYASTELSVTVEQQAADLLHRAVGDDLIQLATELDKLASYANGGPVDNNAVAAIVGVRVTED